MAGLVPELVTGFDHDHAVRQDVRGIPPAPVRPITVAVTEAVVPPHTVEMAVVPLTQTVVPSNAGPV